MLDILVERENFPEVSRLFPLNADFWRQRILEMRRRGDRRYNRLLNAPYVSNWKINSEYNWIEKI